MSSQVYNIGEMGKRLGAFRILKLSHYVFIGTELEETALG